MLALSYPHDIIEFLQSPATSNFAQFHELYLKGLSLRQISIDTGFPKSTIRKVLVLNNVVLRTNEKIQNSEQKKPQRTFLGGIHYGYTALDGKLVIDPKEVKIVRKILGLYQNGISFNAISKELNKQKIPSKLGKNWSDVSVASVIRKHLNKNEKDGKNE